MAVIKLTDLTVRSLSEGVYFDERTPGFGILIGKRRKTWLVVKGTGRVRVRVGHYPSLPLSEARRKAMVLLGSPSDQRPAISFLEARNEFLETHPATLRPLSRYQITRILRRHFDWQKPLNKITHADVVAALDRIDAPSERAHALKDIRTFFNWCIPRYLSSSPCIGIKKPTDKARERVLTDEELAKVWQRTREIGYPYGTIVQLLILTGQRSGEIAALQWDWIKGDTITLPSGVTKNGRASTVPISATTKAVIDELPRLGPLLFTARGYTDRPFVGFGVSKIELDRSGVENFTHHDLRRTFATNLAALGVRQEVTEKLLNHVSGKVSGVAAIYNRHAYLDEMRQAIDLWERQLLTIVS